MTKPSFSSGFRVSERLVNPKAQDTANSVRICLVKNVHAPAKDLFGQQAGPRVHGGATKGPIILTCESLFLGRVFKDAITSFMLIKALH